MERVPKERIKTPAEKAKRGRPPGAGEKTRTRLIEAATKQFASGEYGEVSLESIARMAGVTAPSVFRHFANKEELYSEVMREALRTFGEQFAKLLRPEEEASKSLLRLAEFFWDYCQQNPELARLLIRDATSNEGTLLRTAETGSNVLFGFLREFTEQAQASGMIRRFHPDTFVLFMGAMPLMHFGVPALRKQLFRDVPAKKYPALARSAYLQMVDEFLRPKK